MEVLNALRKNHAYIPPSHSNLPIEDVFMVLRELLQQRNDKELTSEALYAGIDDLLTENMHLSFSKKIRNCNLGKESLLLLLCFCHLFVDNEHDEILFRDIDDYFEEGRIFNRIKMELSSGGHPLMKINYVENANADGFGNRQAFKLTDKAKKELLAELDIKALNKNNKKGLMLSSAITEKMMFYNKKEEDSIYQLVSLLQPENFKNVQERLGANGMRNGFACLFYGPPGYG
jgi:hypothetical protein